MNHKDHFGVPLKLGDTVVCKYVMYTSTDLRTGKVIRFTPKQVEVDMTYIKELKKPHEVFVINDQITANRANYPELFI